MECETTLLIVKRNSEYIYIYIEESEREREHGRDVIHDVNTPTDVWVLGEAERKRRGPIDRHSAQNIVAVFQALQAEPPIVKLHRCIPRSVA
jgi:hypothetical protein